jgi:hypothetical protein
VNQVVEMHQASEMHHDSEGNQAFEVIQVAEAVPAVGWLHSAEAGHLVGV